MAYLFENKLYSTRSLYDTLVADVMKSHPELLDDDLNDFIDFGGEVEEVEVEFTVHYWSMSDSRSYRVVVAEFEEDAIKIVDEDRTAQFAQLNYVSAKRLNR